MDIIISANEIILSLTQENKLMENMSENEYRKWLENIARMGKEDEEELQKVSF